MGRWGGKLHMFSPTKLFFFGSVALVLAALLGTLIQAESGVDDPRASKSLKLDDCVLLARENMFRGQPVETEARFMWGSVDGPELVGKGECEESYAIYALPAESDLIGMEDYLYLRRQPDPAEFSFSLVGMIPQYPDRYGDVSIYEEPGQAIHSIQILRFTGLSRARRVKNAD